MAQKSKDFFLILHNIRSLHNVGSIFRTSEAAGVSKIYLTGYTPNLFDIFGKPLKEISKTALGAEKLVAWEKQEDITKLIQNFPPKADPPRAEKIKKIQIIALEQDRKSIDYRKFKPKFPLALILGNEVRGLSKSILKKCDAVIEIPLFGKKESLNVAVAAGIALFKIAESSN